jgi:hypothetical protein
MSWASPTKYAAGQSGGSALRVVIPFGPPQGMAVEFAA